MTIDCIPRNQIEFPYDLVRSPKSGALLRTSLSSSRFGHSFIAGGHILQRLRACTFIVVLEACVSFTERLDPHFLWHDRAHPHLAVDPAP